MQAEGKWCGLGLWKCGLKSRSLNQNKREEREFKADGLRVDGLTYVGLRNN